MEYDKSNYRKEFARMLYEKYYGDCNTGVEDDIDKNARGPVAKVRRKRRKKQCQDK